jgi:NADPH:quinone reductase
MMTKAIRFHETGGADVLKFETVEVGEPGFGEARVRHSFIAVNFADIYFRTGFYPLPLPNGLGTDAVGVVEAVGPGVTDIRVGDRVGYLVGPPGAYSQVRVMPANVLIPLPDGISDRTAASLIMKGMTAQYLFRQVFPLKGGETILYHAAAGGVGLIACQWARAMGVTMIGTVSTDEKAEIAKAHGCAHTIVTSRENIAQRVREITGGKGVPVVYDSVGKDTLEASLDSLQTRGTLVSNGTSSGPVIIDVKMLGSKGGNGSFWVTRPAMRHYIEPRSHMLDMARELFDHVLAGNIVSEPRQSFALADAAQAHRALEGRKTIGSTVLVP